MKKVLIVGHFWPYRQGSGRVLGLAKHLMEFGWQPKIGIEQGINETIKWVEDNWDVISQEILEYVHKE